MRHGRDILKRMLVCIWAIGVAFFGVAANAELRSYEKPFPVQITARNISSFLPSDPGRSRFGKLEFSSGLELFSNNEHFGGYSGFRLLKGRSRFVAISDLGFWLVGDLEREGERLTGVANSVAAPIRGHDGSILIGKWSADAEGLDLLGDSAILTFERDHRVEFHGLDLEKFNGDIRTLPVDFSKLGLRGNKGLEAIVAVPDRINSPIDLLIFSERSLDRLGNNRAFAVTNGKIAEFGVKRIRDYDITASAFLPNGNLILLERRYSVAKGVALRLRTFDFNQVQKGAVLDGEILFEADMNYQIDNFEGLDVSQNAEGQTYLTMISDDNRFLLQRTLLLEFKLLMD